MHLFEKFKLKALLNHKTTDIPTLWDITHSNQFMETRYSIFVTLLLTFEFLILLVDCSSWQCIPYFIFVHSCVLLSISLTLFLPSRSIPSFRYCKMAVYRPSDPYGHLLSLIAIAWSDLEYFYSLLNGMLVLGWGGTPYNGPYGEVYEMGSFSVKF